MTPLQTLVHAASLAPSSHNTQPWRFRINDSVITLIADRTRALPVNDPDDRELTISCGCALLNLRVASAAIGREAVVELLPDPADPDVLARVRLTPAASRSEDAHLESAMADRRTYREEFADTPVEAAHVRALVDAAVIEGATLIVLDTPERRLAAAALVAEGDGILWANPSWRRELAAWMHPRGRGDGLMLPGLAIPVAQTVVRTFDLGNRVGAKDRHVADESPVLAVLATRGDGPRDWLVAGQALQRLLLVGVQRGLQASYLNQPVQVPALRPTLQQLAGHQGHPQLLLRLGVACRTLPAAPRRSLDEIIDDPAPLVET